MKNWTPEQRLSLTHEVMELLDSWGIRAEAKIGVLGLPEGTRSRMLRKFYDETPLPDDPQVMEHVYHIIAIGDALRTTYPRNPRMGEKWMRRAHRRFDNRAPVQELEERGMSGLIRVLAHLDCSYAWDRSGSQSAKN